MSGFPALSQPFSVYAVLTDAFGNATMEINIVSLATDEEIYSYFGALHFADKLTELRVHVRVRECKFSQAGRYQVSLLVDGEPIAQRVIDIYSKEE